MSVERALEGVGGALDDRFRGAKGFRTLFRKIFPDHWTFLLGEIALYSFIILLLTGTFLTFFFQPSMTEVVYHGSFTHLNGAKMSEAYASTLNISFDVRGGLLMRQIHHWAADLFVAAILAHMLRIFFTGAYRKPREVNWLIGLTMLTLALLEGLFGYSLPDDLLSGAGLRITEGVMQSIPLVGTYLAFFLFGGAYPGNDIIPRMYIIHVLLIPAIILALVTAHLFIMFHQKHTQMPGKGRTERNVVGAPMYPYFMAKTGAFFFFTFAACALAATFAQINPIWLYGPYNPVSISSGSQPDFYMGFLEGSLRMMPPGSGTSPGTRSASTCSSRPSCRWASSSPRPPSGRSWNSGSPAINASTTSTTGRGTRPPGRPWAWARSRSTACCGPRAPTTSLPTTWTSRSTPSPGSPRSRSSSCRWSPTSSRNASAWACSARICTCCSMAWRPASSGSCRTVNSSRRPGRSMKRPGAVRRVQAAEPAPRRGDVPARHARRRRPLREGLNKIVNESGAAAGRSGHTTGHDNGRRAADRRRTAYGGHGNGHAIGDGHDGTSGPDGSARRAPQAGRPARPERAGSEAAVTPTGHRPPATPGSCAA